MHVHRAILCTDGRYVGHVQVEWAVWVGADDGRARRDGTGLALGGGATGGKRADRGLSADDDEPNPALFLLPMGAVKVELGRTRA